jgi:pimeloyl-ACP methyl ester carboxylesterase
VTALSDPTAAPLAHDRLGSGPPLVLLHGLGGERHVWEPVLERLAAERELIVPDLPGFGASPPLTQAPLAQAVVAEEGAARNAGEGADARNAAGSAREDAGAPTPAALAAAVARLLDALGLERPAVAGNSLGGWVALELAVAGRASAVVGICPAGFWRRPLEPGRDGARRLARALRPLVPALVRIGPLRRAALASNVDRPERVPPRAAARMIRTYGDAPGFAAVNAAMRAGRFDPATLAQLAPVPVMLAWGERDRLIRPPRAPLPAGVESLLLPGCGHLAMWDDPALVADTILRATAP